MMEKIKSILLIALIAFSLLQTYWLVYPAPRFESLDDKPYITAEPIGTAQEIDDLIFPTEIIVHFGEGRHTVLLPHSIRYNAIYNKLTERTLEGLRLSETGTVLDDLTSSFYQGVEIRFGQSIPLQVLQNVIPIKANVLDETIRISRIWITMQGEDNPETRTYLFTDMNTVVYEAEKANITEKDLRGFIDFQPVNREYLELVMNGNRIYIPQFDLPMDLLNVPYTLIQPYQLIQNFFADPRITRNLQERDGSQIYTDGKRGLQIKQNGHWMNYSDPIAPVGQSNELHENLFSAMQFINHRGGWNGKFLFESAIDHSNGVQEIVFRQYYGSYPIVAHSSEGYGLVRVQLQNGQIFDFERTLITLIPSDSISEKVTLPGGEILIQALEVYDSKDNVKRVMPVYRPELHNETLRLVPAWAVELRDGTVELLS